jgi:predicted ATPase
MSDQRDVLQRMFDETNRFANFGDAIVEIGVSGVRCHQNTRIQFGSPISAFCGLNGTGKSTLLQLAATAYRPPLDEPYNISDFMVVSALDPNPFAPHAKVEFKFWSEQRTARTLTFSRSTLSTRWRGYNRRREGGVFFAGIGMYLPRTEQPSFAARAPKLKVTESQDVIGRIYTWTCKILGQNYNKIVSHLLNVTDRRGGRISTVHKGQIGYSEAHMGFGEARTIHIVSTLETIPDKSLVLLEEPETSLHLSAQHEFGRYLVDVARHKRHQVLLTTHSEFLLQALPSASRLYLEKSDSGIRVIPGLTAVEARSLMALGHQKALTVLVEDECAKAILSEIVRRHDLSFLQSLNVCVGGDKDSIRNTVVGLKKTTILIAAVRDGDKAGSPSENIFKLPGSLPPEKELFQAAAVETYVKDHYGLQLSDFRSEIDGVDHHSWCERLAVRIGADERALTWELSRVYARALPESETSTLVNLLKEATRR